MHPRWRFCTHSVLSVPGTSSMMPLQKCRNPSALDPPTMPTMLLHRSLSCRPCHQTPQSICGNSSQHISHCHVFLSHMPLQSNYAHTPLRESPPLDPMHTASATRITNIHSHPELLPASHSQPQARTDRSSQIVDMSTTKSRVAAQRRRDSS